GGQRRPRLPSSGRFYQSRLAARIGIQLSEKWLEMVRCCWVFEDNVSRETFFSSRERITNWWQKDRRRRQLRRPSILLSDRTRREGPDSVAYPRKTLMVQIDRAV